MKICLVHNEYGKPSGEETVVNAVRNLLEKNGHEVIPFFRSSAEIPAMRFGQIRAFFSGIWNPASARAMRRILAEHRPDIVHIHNLFPLVSPSVLPECRQAGIPVVMTVHNYRLICPNGLFMSHGKRCERCAGGHEYHCIFRNCEEGIFKSTGYALRNFVARKLRFFLDNITVYAALTDFQRQKLIQNGFSANRISVIPNMVSPDFAPGISDPGEYIGYAGRISPEKGISTLMAAACKLRNIPFRAAGNYESMPFLPEQIPDNLELAGYLDAEEIRQFYGKSRMIVLPSTCYEGFPMGIIEGMLHGKPLVCSRIGGIPEIVEHGITGLLFESGNEKDLAEKIRYLWERPELCQKMGQAGRKKVLREYMPQKYYERLMTVYEKALEIRYDKTRFY